MNLDSWTKTPPAKEGWYWVQARLKENTYHLGLVEILSTDDDESLYCCPHVPSHIEDGQIVHAELWWWPVPIAMPKDMEA